MREELENYTNKQARELPNINIKFCYDRVVISWVSNKSYIEHKNIYYGLFFWWKLKKELKSLYKQQI